MLASHSVTAHTVVTGTLHSSAAVMGVCMRVCVCACVCVRALVGNSMSTEKIAGAQEHWAPALSPFPSECWGLQLRKASTNPLLRIPKTTFIPLKGNLNLYKARNPLLPLPASRPTDDPYLYFSGKQRPFHGNIKIS